MPDLITKKNLRHEIRKALSHLYEPFELRNSLLAQILPVSQTSEKAQALRSMLQEAIRQNKPDSNEPSDTSATRAYEVLYYRYIEQSPLKEVAAEMALSTRQVHRIEAMALQDLTDYLALKYNLDLVDEEEEPSTEDSGSSDHPVEPANNQGELDWIKKSFRAEEISFSMLFESVISTVSPMIQRGSIQMEGSLRTSITADETTLRQALVNVLIAAIHSSIDGCITVRSEIQEDQVNLLITARSKFGETNVTQHEISDVIDLATQLLEMNEGRMQITVDHDNKAIFTAKVILPVTKKITVLVVDDNADALRLMERYLDGTRYQFIGVRNPKEVAVVVLEKRPQIIILDVMMPEIDGWQMLNQLKTYGVSPASQVIISTILPQESLALAFGAAGFIRKPVTQEKFLAVLHQLASQPGLE
jgi:CheY-like chemotaxis protein